MAMTEKERERYEDAKKACAALMLFYPFTLEDLPEEEWRDIFGYEGYYQESNYGRTKSFWFGKEKILKPFVDKDGYLLVDLYKDGKHKKYKVHQIVGMTFIPNPENKPQVDHIDTHKMNNYASNLRWATNTENQNYAIEMGLRKSVNGRRLEQLTEAEMKRCQEIYIKGDPEFGAAALARKFGISHKSMWQIVTGKTYKKAGGGKKSNGDDDNNEDK